MPAYVVFTREKTTDADSLAAYAKKSGGTLAGHPVKPLAAYGKHEVLEGAPIEGAVILEFPTIEAAKAWYDGPAYREVRELRFKGADYRAFIIEGL
jgi:uncharacterized protein (DUF1330 family)